MQSVTIYANNIKQKKVSFSIKYIQTIKHEHKPIFIFHKADHKATSGGFLSSKRITQNIYIKM